MKYKISEDSDFTVVTEDGEFVCNVVPERTSIDKLIGISAKLQSTAKMIVDALNNDFSN